MAEAQHSPVVPNGYRPLLGIRETELAIKRIKDGFEARLAEKLNLTRVSAPLFVRPETGLNDNLNGVERPVCFDVADLGGKTCEIVHSLAKWKRMALAKYGFSEGEGLYTDMNAIRRDERLDNLHSIYVDQWDWERVISREERGRPLLERIVASIHEVFLETERDVCAKYPQIRPILPKHIHFVTAQELEDQFPALDPRAREDAICREYGAVFVMQIGRTLRSGTRHDGRAPDYDDWQLNGDIFYYYPVLARAFEVSSMGIRVDAASLVEQLRSAGCEERLRLPFHRDLIEDRLPLSIGGGLGQSRICMMMLRKAHIGEVQASAWPEAMVDECARLGVSLL